MQFTSVQCEFRLIYVRKKDQLIILFVPQFDLIPTCLFVSRANLQKTLLESPNQTDREKQIETIIVTNNYGNADSK